MEIKITGHLTKSFFDREAGDPVEVEIDLYDINTDVIEHLAETRLGMTYERNFDYSAEDCALDNSNIFEIVNYMESIGYKVKDLGEYSNLRERIAYEKLLDNMDKVSIEKIEELVKDL